DALSRDEDRRRLQHVDEGLDHEAAADDRVAAVVVHPRDLRALLLLARREQLDDLVHLGPPETVAVEARDRIDPRPAGDPGPVADGAPRAHEVLAALERRHAGVREQLPGVIAQLLDLRGRRGVGLQEGVADAQRAEGHAHAAHQPTLAEAGHLDAAAAEVEEDAVVDGKPAHRAQEAITGLLLAGQGSDLYPQLRADLLDEGRAVLRVADGGRRERHHLRGPGAASDRAEVLEGVESALERVGPEAVRLVQLADEAERGAAAGQDLHVALDLVAVDDHPARVRADVDHGQEGRHPALPRLLLLPGVTVRPRPTDP